MKKKEILKELKDLHDLLGLTKEEYVNKINGMFPNARPIPAENAYLHMLGWTSATLLMILEKESKRVNNGSTKTTKKRNKI